MISLLVLGKPFCQWAPPQVIGLVCQQARLRKTHNSFIYCFYFNFFLKLCYKVYVMLKGYEHSKIIRISGKTELKWAQNALVVFSKSLH